MDITSFVLGYKKGKATGGGGGGSLPPGAYWEQKTALPLEYRGSHFVYNGDLYYWASTTSNGSTCTMYKYADGVYTKVFDFDSVLEQLNVKIVEFNGVVHAHDTDTYYHYTVDFANQIVTKANDFPKNYHHKFVWNGSFYSVGAASFRAGLYKWNPDDDTWAESADINNCPLVEDSFYYEGQIYLVGSQKLYNIVEGEAIEVGSFNSSREYGVLNGDCYYYHNSYTLRKYDLVKKIDTVVGTIPYLQYNRMYVWDNEVRFVGGSLDYFKTNIALHEIEATE